MGRGHVERLEVVPVGLGLGTLGHGEAHGDEGVLQFAPGLGHQVQMPPTVGEPGQRRLQGPAGELGQIEPFGLGPGLPVGVLSSRDEVIRPFLAGAAGWR